MQDLKVYVVEFGDRKAYQLQWIDPGSGKKKTRSSGVEITGRKRERAEAERKAAALEASLREGSFVANRFTWAAFRERYEDEVCKRLAKNTATKISCVFNVLERTINPRMLSDLTAERLSSFQAKLRELGRAESGIKGTLAHLKASLRWAERIGMIAKAPRIDMPKRLVDKMKGRPITLEEFERMIAAVPKVITNEDHVKQWQFFLRGLWLSGLRLMEAINLHWDRNDTLRVELQGRRPMLSIPAAMDKGKKDRLLPITPDFAAMLAEIPLADRTGWLFPLPSRQRENVGRIVSSFGEKALVRVAVRAAKNEKGESKSKFASAHDLRRSFGERWASKVMPTVLRELMRHESLQTTMAFYVGTNAERTADAVWEAFSQQEGNTLANNPAFCDVEEATEEST